MSKKGISATLSAFIVCFYAVIIMYVLFAVLHVDTLANFIAALIFEIIGIILLGYFVLCNFALKPIKTGYFVPLIMVTVIYTVILDIINMACVATMAHSLFVLINLIVLFVYCVVSIPMYIMGNR
ncbi:MAG: hypothetical protein KBS96_08590 [Lachnospiraceae bacterium]|nr:hypothetical protein [Candidatus Colinaster scatohippi]